MTDQTIKCPKCGREIELTEALTGQIEQNIRAKYEAEAAVKEKDYQAKLQEIKQQQKELERKDQAIDEQVAEQIKAERKKIAEQEKAKILVEQAEQTRILEEEIKEKTEKIKAAQQQELELRKQQRKLQEEKEAFELEVARKLDEERKKIAEDAGQKAAEEQMLKLREKDNLVKSLQEQIENLKRRAEVGSQEAEGEALEGQLQEVLEQAFPYDQFAEIKKGARGADILQTVRNSMGKECGTILWESKNTKDFQKGWIEKLKKDQQESGADVAVIMSMALPKEIDRFGMYEDIWVTDYSSAIGLCVAVRQGLIKTERERIVTVGRESVKDVIYNYITSNEFTMHVSLVVNAYKAMKDDLESEKRSLQRIWSKREKQINTILDNVTQMYGSIEGMVGQKVLPTIEPLSLDAIVEND
ncbi:MAG: DUF2130 domain-containing protein [Planctomycetota bacterium]|jgi:hypothetical protein